MGRGKLILKRIEDEKSRINTYQKRKKGLKKKIEELSILCGVPTCMIAFGPKIKNQPPELQIWPQDLPSFMEVIDLYRSTSHGIKSYTLLNFLDERKRKVDDKINKHRKFNMESRFPSSWDDRFNSFSLDQLSNLIVLFDNNIELARGRIIMLKTAFPNGYGDDHSISIQNNIIDQANHLQFNKQLVIHQTDVNYPTFYCDPRAVMVNSMTINHAGSMYLLGGGGRGGSSMHTMQNYDQYYASLPSNMPLQLQGSSGYFSEFYGDPRMNEFEEIKGDNSIE